MTDEMTLCTIIVNSIKSSGGVAWKIPDPSGAFATAIARPFDILGATKEGCPLYIEAKFLKTLESFNLQKIESHQMESLLSLKKLMPTAECWIVLGVKIPRKNRVYVFKDIYEIERRRKAKENFKMKELETLPYFSIKNDIIQWDGMTN
jgi:penicillin-binding protein-related factor A (putative recombinase)